MNKILRCCFPQKQDITQNNQNEEMEVKNTDDRIELLSSSKSKSRTKQQEKISSRNEKEVVKTDIINLDKPMNSISTNFANFKSEKGNSNITNTNKDESVNSKQNGFDVKNNSNINNNDIMKASNIKGKQEDYSIFDITNGGRVISDQEIKNAPVLLIEEISGDILKNNKLTINAAGLVNGMRKLRDGVAFFGKQLKSGDQIVNDFELNIDYPGAGIFSFIIYYKKENNKYYLRAYRDKQTSALSMLLIKLDEEYFINRKEILSISDYFFQLTPNSDKLEIHKLASKNAQNSEKFSFDNSQEIITIGRDSKCNIPFVGDKAFSKIQTTFIFDKENNCWKIKDGCTEKASTNGTWIFAAHSYEINDKTIFRVGNSKLMISYQ